MRPGFLAFTQNSRAHCTNGVAILLRREGSFPMATQTIPQVQQSAEVTEALERLSLVLARAFLSTPPSAPARKRKARVLARATRRSGEEGGDSVTLNPS